jgi:hypothetical protein
MVLLEGRVAVMLGSGDAAQLITLHSARDIMAEPEGLRGRVPLPPHLRAFEVGEPKAKLLKDQ